jgi:hypothetical protein
MAGGRFTAEQVTQNLAKSQATRPQAGGLKVVSARRGAKVPRERFATVNEFVDVAMRCLSGVDVKVWMTVWRDTRHGTACVSNRELGLRSGHDERSVRRAVRTLVRSGWLEVVKRGGIGRGASVYRVRVGRELRGK